MPYLVTHLTWIEWTPSLLIIWMVWQVLPLRYLMVVTKDGNATGITVGRYAGLVSFKENSAGTSMKVGIQHCRKG